MRRTVPIVPLLLAGLAVPVAALSIGDSLVVKALDFQNDGKWEWQNWCGSAWHSESRGVLCIHKGYTVGVRMEGQAWIPAFAGPSGEYKVRVGIHAKYNGSADYAVFVNNTRIGGGQTPVYGSYGNDGCFPIDVNNRVRINNGDKITYWGKIAWYGSSGSYAGFYDMRFVYLGGGVGVAAAAVRAALPVIAESRGGGDLVVQVNAAGAHAITVSAVNGRTLFAGSGVGPAVYRVGAGAAGVRIVRYKDEYSTMQLSVAGGG